MPILTEPWRRAKGAELAELPPVPTTDWIMAQSQRDLARVLRDNLVCRDGYPPKQWRRFWDLIGLDEHLTDCATAILTDFQQLADAEDPDSLDELQARRLRKFRLRVADGLTRLARAETAPLSWAGTRAERFNAPARQVIDDLVTAIDNHRDDHDDAALYAVLKRLDLDPR